MKIARTFKKITLVTAGALLITIVGLLFSFQNSADAQEKTIKEMKELGVEASTFQVPFGDDEINTVYVGNIRNPKLLLIHGSPGDWTGWSGFMTDSILLENFFMIALDRPGFGKTTLDAQKDLAVHGEAATAVMRQFGPNEQFIVVGHSYGGAVVGQLMVSVPEMIEKAVLAAPAISPDHQEARWYNKLARYGLIKAIIGKDMRSSNVEMLGLTESLKNIEEGFDSITVPHTFIHGERDILVPYETVDYWKSHKLSSVEYVLREKMNHFVPWSDPELIKNAILGIKQE